MGLQNYILLVLSSSLLNLSYGQDFRLPETQIPSEYDIKLIFPSGVFLNMSRSISGSVLVTFQTTVRTDTVLIHSPQFPQEVFLKHDTGEIWRKSVSFNDTTEILTITFGEELIENSDYTLEINYMATLDEIDRRGVYRSTYRDNLGQRVLVATQLEPTYARKLFPCFDEPRYKANFSLQLTFPASGLTALSNTRGSLPSESGQSVTVNFDRTPKMSTYLLGFVISNFTCTSAEASPILHRVCSRPAIEADSFLVNNSTLALINSLEEVTGYSYSNQGIGKLDQVAIPDFHLGAMENWGLPIYREALLLWNSQESSNFDKQRVLSVVARKLAHFWFGNLVTSEWWDNVFLSEGFASYFQYFTPASVQSIGISENWQMEKQFIVEQLQEALGVDGHLPGNALSSAVETPDEIWKKLDVISQSKGASILRMIENFIGTQTFYNGIKTYVASRAFQTAVPLNLWNSLETAIEPNFLPVPLTEIMENWITKPGFPIVKVSLQGNNVNLAQKRYLYDHNANDPTEWYIPISYTLSNDTSQFSNVIPKDWLRPGTNVILHNILPNNKWIILNNQQSAYYRVNYDRQLWDEIRIQLFNNHDDIDVLNRAQIVDDLFNLARIGEVDYSLAFSILKYLSNETDYFPWYSAIKGFDYLLTVYGETSDIGQQLIDFQYYLLQSVYKVVPFVPPDASNQILTLKAGLILNRLCLIGREDCVATAKSLYADFKNGTGVDKNLKSVVYCNGLRYSNDSVTDWHHLWGILANTNVASEKREIIRALGCTTNISLLNFYLENSINYGENIRLQDLASVWESVYTSSSIGLNAALDFFVTHYQTIITRYSDYEVILKNIAQRISSSDQLAKLENLALLPTNSLQDVLQRAIVTANFTLVWQERHRNTITEYFTNNLLPETTYPNPGPQTPNPGPQTPDPGPQTPNPGPQTPNPGPQTPNPGPDMPNPETPKPEPGGSPSTFFVNTLVLLITTLPCIFV